MSGESAKRVSNIISILSSKIHLFVFRWSCGLTTVIVLVAMESSSPCHELKCMLLPSHSRGSDIVLLELLLPYHRVSHYGNWCLDDKVYPFLIADVISSESSAAGERMHERVKVN